MPGLVVAGWAGGAAQKSVFLLDKSLIFWPICIKFGTWVHCMGVDTRIYFEDLASLRALLHCRGAT